jgi:hypothetical protein
MKILIAILAILTFLNIALYFWLGTKLDGPRTSVTSDVLGAVFYNETDAQVIDVPLARPPRKAVNPGDISEQDMTLTNTVDFPIYFRAQYILRIDDADGNKVENFDANVIVHMSDKWDLRDGYWYYTEAVHPGEAIDGMIASIEYSENFAEHRDYKVYLPFVVESVEVCGNDIHDIDYWPNTDINSVDYKRLDQDAELTINIEIA